MQSDALISPCGKYRYWLTRRWDMHKPEVCFIMLNPSTADGREDDPTIRRCVAFAKSWGHGRLIVVNLFAYRATKPQDLWDFDAETKGEAQGPENNSTILSAARSAQLVVCAWGKGGSYCLRGLEVVTHLCWNGIRPMVLRINKDGSPAHPLYLPASLTPIPLP